MTQSDHFFIIKQLKIPKGPLVAVLLGAAAIFAGFVFWWATALHGMGIRNDSVTFLWMAENLSRGVGAGVTNTLGQFKPVTQFPPLYPLLLSFSLWISRIFYPQTDVEQISRLLGVFITGASIWVFGWLTFKISSRSIMFVSLAAFVLLSSPIFWDTYLYATPEPFLIFFSLVALYLFKEYLRTFLPSTLFVASLFVGLSVLTGYSGLYLIPVMGISLFAFTRRSRKRNFIALGNMLALGLLPIMFWEFINYTITGSVARWQPIFTPITPPEWIKLWVSFTTWFAPFINLVKIAPVGLGLLLAFSALIVSLIIYYRRRVYGNNESQEMWWKILIMGIFSYLITLLCLKSFYSAFIFLEETHIIFPVYIWLLLLIFSLLANAKEIRFLVMSKRAVSASFGAIHLFILFFLILNFQQTYANMVISRENGLALNSIQIKNSPLALSLRNLVTTNVLYFSDNREKFYWITNKTPSSDLGDIEECIGKMIKGPLEKHDIVIALMNEPWINVDVLKYYPSAQKVYKGTDGAIFVVRNILVK